MKGKSRRAVDRVEDIRQAIADAAGDLGEMTRAQFLASRSRRRAIGATAIFPPRRRSQ
jgi:hypothetical protein